MKTDPWHYPRTALAEQVLGMFETGLSSALVFFAPRRMGKTEFLCKDITPLATSKHWKVFYFSFLDVGTNAAVEFTKALARFAEGVGVLGKTRQILRRINKIDGQIGSVKAGIELHGTAHAYDNLKEIITRLSAYGKVLLLMDEVQTLAKDAANANFVAMLRTAFDLHKDTIKVIFTGSSQEGLRCMFSQAKAPFFHFSQNLPFPDLNRGFTDHLVQMFARVTKRNLDSDALWDLFQKMQKIPQLARALVERVALNPYLSLEQAYEELITTVFHDRAFVDIWEKCTQLERLLLKEIVLDGKGIFSEDIRSKFVKLMGVKALSVATIQSAMRMLQRKGLISRLPERGGYCIDDPNFKNWLCSSQDER